MREPSDRFLGVVVGAGLLWVAFCLVWGFLLEHRASAGDSGGGDLLKWVLG